MKNNVSKIKDCFGCGVCSAICPKKIIDMGLNKNGFYEPNIVDQDKCINCGLCLNVCSYSSKTTNDSVITGSWAAWSDDKQIRQKCSSGGIGFEICRHLLNQGYKIIACKYNAQKKRAEHYIATNEIELIESIGSKYIQSFTQEAFQHINRQDKYAIVGTPCQIDSLRKMCKKMKIENNVILVDFFCHCVPSMLAWEAYLKMVEKKIGQVKYASWRNKFEFGWHDSWLMCADNTEAYPDESISQKRLDWHDSYNLLVREKKGKWMCRKSQGDLFYNLFLGDFALNPACSKDCRFKMANSSADIRIGDLWGNEYMSNKEGVSALISFTNKGRNIIESLDNATLIRHPFEIVAEGQMRHNAHPKEMYPIAMYLLRNKYPLDGKTFRSVFEIQRIISGIKRRLLKK